LDDYNFPIWIFLSHRRFNISISKRIRFFLNALIFVPVTLYNTDRYVLDFFADFQFTSSGIDNLIIIL